MSDSIKKNMTWPLLWCHVVSVRTRTQASYLRTKRPQCMNVPSPPSSSQTCSTTSHTQTSKRSVTRHWQCVRLFSCYRNNHYWYNV